MVCSRTIILLISSLGLVARSAEADETALNLMLFGDVRLESSSSDTDKGGFELGVIDLYASGQISERWSGLVELVFELDQENQLFTDLERVEVSYDYSDALRVTAGRSHTPIVRWNVLQHHAAYVQTTIDRPAMAEWEDMPGVWPVHFVGVGVSGRFKGAMSPSYYLGIGNGRGSELDEIQVGSDVNRGRALMAVLGAAPLSVPGLQLNIAVYKDRITTSSEGLDELDIAASFAYRMNSVELAGEWSRMEHQSDELPVTYRTEGWYVLFTTSLGGRLETIQPYLLIDRVDIDEREAFLGDARDTESWAVGARWDITRGIALKADYRSARLTAEDRQGSVRCQLSFSID